MIEPLPKAQVASTIISSLFRPYLLSFNREDDGHWYLNYPFLPFNLHHQMMVACADNLCAFLSDDNRTVCLEVYPGYEPLYDKSKYACLVRGHNSVVSGSHYQAKGLPGFEGGIWLSPATLLVLGHYPKRIYIRKWVK